MLILAAASSFLAAFLAVQLVNWASLDGWRKSAGQHWAERARILWPVRRTSNILMIYVPLLLAAAASLVWEAAMWQLVVCWISGIAGAIGGSWFLTRELFPAIGLRAWLYDVAIGLTLRLALWGGLIAIGFTMPADFTSRTWLTLLGGVALLVLWPAVALWVLRLSGIIRPADERLRRIAAECDKDGQSRVKGLWLASGTMANAVALPLSGTLVFFDRLMEILSDEEVASVCSHEIGHLAESKWIVVGRHLGGMAVLPMLLIHPAFSHWGILGVYGLLVLMIVWSRLARKLMRRMETRADAIASHQQANDGVYATALEKLYQSNQVPAVMPGNNAIHPHLYDRMTLAGTPPAFPRPQPPDKFTTPGWILLFVAPLMIGVIYGYHADLGKLFLGDRGHPRPPARVVPKDQ